MIYAFESHARRRTLHLLVWSCFMAAFLLFGVSGIAGLAFPVLYQISAVGLLVAGTYLLTGYILKLYRYELCESGVLDSLGDPVYDLVITEILGRRRRVVTRVSLRDVEKALVLPRKAQKGLGGAKQRVCRYDNDPYAPKSLCLFLPEEGTVVVIPADEGMIKILGRLVAVGKEEI